MNMCCVSSSMLFRTLTQSCEWSCKKKVWMENTTAVYSRRKSRKNRGELIFSTQQKITETEACPLSGDDVGDPCPAILKRVSYCWLRNVAHTAKEKRVTIRGAKKKWPILKAQGHISSVGRVDNLRCNDEAESVKLGLRGKINENESRYNPKQHRLHHQRGKKYISFKRPLCD